MDQRGFRFRSGEGFSNNLRSATKTGTTICGVLFDGGVLLGADTRSTNGETVADKNCEKIHYIAPNIYCCGAGTAADTESVTGVIASNLLLHRAQTDRTSRGHVGAALVLGGVDSDGPQLFAVYPHGSSDSLPFAAMGSGCLAAMAILESGYYDNMSLADATSLVTRAIFAGILNDLGSGSFVDLCVITEAGVQYLRNHESKIRRIFRMGPEHENRRVTASVDHSTCHTSTRLSHP